MCVNSCILFRGPYGRLDRCPKCDECRFQQDTKESAIRRQQLGHVIDTSKFTIEEKMKSFAPRKVFYYSPLIPRLQNLFAHPVLSRLFHYADAHMVNADPNIADDIHQSILYHRFARQFPLYSEGRHGISTSTHPLDLFSSTPHAWFVHTQAFVTFAWHLG